MTLPKKNHPSLQPLNATIKTYQFRTLKPRKNVRGEVGP